MAETATDMLLECLVEALQTFAFIAAEPIDPGLDWSGEAYGHSVSFKGSRSGSLHVAASAALGRQMAANLLGVEPGSPEAEEMGQDVVRELCNVVTGLWLRRQGIDDETMPEMGLPVSAALTEGGWAEWVGAAGSVALNAEGIPIVARIEEVH